jgi:predicted nucleic acid-binding protein
VASLIDTNILVYRFDPRDPVKQRIAQEVAREGQATGNLLVPYQALVEFVATVTRPRKNLGDAPLMPRDHALLQVERFMLQFEIVWPDYDVLRTAIRGAALYSLSWFDALLWAHAEARGIPEILSEDFEHGRHYGRARVVNPFLAAEGGVHELPPLYAPAQISPGLIARRARSATDTP